MFSNNKNENEDIDFFSWSPEDAMQPPVAAGNSKRSNHQLCEWRRCEDVKMKQGVTKNKQNKQNTTTNAHVSNSL